VLQELLGVSWCLENLPKLILTNARSWMCVARFGTVWYYHTPLFRIHTSLSDLLKDATATCANQCGLTMLFLVIQTKSWVSSPSLLCYILQVQHLSFSAHTDAKGILDLVKHVAPHNVVLVHGEKLKMVLLKNKIVTDLGEKFTTDSIWLVLLQGHGVEVWGRCLCWEHATVCSPVVVRSEFAKDGCVRGI
jgi:hypothetical protein